MVKGKQEELGKTGTEALDTETEITDSGTEIEAKAKTFTQEELDAFKAEIEAEADKRYQGIQRVVSKKDQEIERLRKAQPRETGDDTLLEVMLQDRRSKATELGEPDPVIARLETELAQRKRKQTQEAQLRWQEQVTQQHREKFDQRIQEAGLDPNDERLDDFQDAFEDAQEDGRFGKAERKLNRILSKVKEPKGKGKSETDEERIERLAEEKLRAKMEEQGLLITETGGPSASSGSWLEFEKRYIAGKVPPEEYEKRARREGKL